MTYTISTTTVYKNGKEVTTDVTKEAKSIKELLNAMEKFRKMYSDVNYILNGSDPVLMTGYKNEKLYKFICEDF